jgi:hypothetical protein
MLEEFAEAVIVSPQGLQPPSIEDARFFDCQELLRILPPGLVSAVSVPAGSTFDELSGKKVRKSPFEVGEEAWLDQFFEGPLLICAANCWTSHMIRLSNRHSTELPSGQLVKLAIEFMKYESKP